MRVDNSTGKGTSGIENFSSEVHRVHMELGGKLFNSLRIKTQFLERLQSVSVVDGATHMRWMSRRVLLRSLGRCCLGLVALLVAGGAAGMLPVSLNCPLPFRRTQPPTLVCCFCVFCVFAAMSHKIWATGGNSVFI
jgi:hypothetical protein